MESNQNGETMELEQVKEKINQEVDEKPKLPEIGTKFMVDGQEYEVVYLNVGKSRFTAAPCKGMY